MHVKQLGSQFLQILLSLGSPNWLERLQLEEQALVSLFPQLGEVQAVTQELPCK